MQISKQVKSVGIGITFVVIAITLIVLIDYLDFVARWLWHIEPYKDNAERIIYACLFTVLVLNIIKKFGAGKIAKGIKGIKANIGSFGFEVEFVDVEKDNSSHCEDVVPKIDKVIETPSNNIQFACRGFVAERRIISILSAELQLTFATNAVLSRGGCRYRPDGFAVRNGRAYIVEVKVGDRPEVMKTAIAQLKTFSDMVQSTKISHVTVILCMVTKHPVTYFTRKIKNVNLGDETEFVFRAFSYEQLEGIENVAS